MLPFKVHFCISVKYLRGFKKPGVISFGIWNLFQNAKKRDCKCFLVFALCVDVSGFSSRMYLFSKTKKVFKYPCRKKRNDAKYFSLTQMKYKEKRYIFFFAFSYCICLILQNSGITVVSFVPKMLPSQLLLCILHTFGWCKRSQHSVEKTLVKILAKLIMPRYFYGIMQKNAQKRDFENLELPHLEKVCLFCISSTHKKYLQSKQWKVICN